MHANTATPTHDELMRRAYGPRAPQEQAPADPNYPRHLYHPLLDAGKPADRFGRPYDGHSSVVVSSPEEEAKVRAEHFPNDQDAWRRHPNNFGKPEKSPEEIEAEAAVAAQAKDDEIAMLKAQLAQMSGQLQNKGNGSKKTEETK